MPSQDAADRARAYHALGRRLWLLSLLADTALPLLFWRSGSAARLAAATARLRWRPAQLAGYAAATGLGDTLLTAPLTFLRGYWLPRRYGLLNQSLGGWLLDAAKAGVLGGVFGLALLEGAYWSFGRFRRRWWLLDGGAALGVSLLVGLVAPVLVAPIFFKFKPLEREAIVGRIERLLARGGMQAQGVYEFNLSRKFSAANAAVFGFGPTRRIVLADSLLDRYTPSEIEAVVAHELGHHAHKDMWIGTAAGGFITLLALRVTALLFAPERLGKRYPLEDVKHLPLWLLAFSLATTLLSPFALAVSRWSERRADAYARQMATVPEALGTGLAKLGEESLADPAPPRWEVLLRYSHPPMPERTAVHAAQTSGGQ